MVEWPSYNNKSIGTVTRSSGWSKSLGIIADQTRSGKFKVRAAHTREPDQFAIVMRMTLPEYRALITWFETIDRKGVHTFAYPKIDDNTGVLAEYAFAEGTGMDINNISGDIVEIKMSWRKA
jgi:hypothetical protein